MTEPSIRRGRFVFAAIAIAAVSVAIRMRNVGGIFLSGFEVLFGTDPWYHLRRIELARAGGLTLPQFDSYVNHPTGALIDWPPGFDILMAAGSFAAEPLLPQSFGLTATLAVMIPLIGALTPLLAMVLACVLYGPRAGVWAGGMLAVLNAMVTYSSVGRVDHHVIEALCLAALLAAYVWSRRESGKWFRSFAAGAAIGLVPGFWPGASVFALPLWLAFAIDGRDDPGVWRDGMRVFATASAFAAVLSSSSQWAWAGSLDYYALSLFQPLVFGAFALSLQLLRLVSLRVAATLAVLLALGLLLLPATRAALERAAAYVFTTESQISTVFESTPLFAMGFPFAIAWLSPWLLAWPLVALFAIRSADSPGRRCVAITLLLMSALAVLQLRFAPLFAVPFAIALAGLLDRAVARVARGAWVDVVASLALFATLWPTLAPSLEKQPVALPHLARSLDALLWLRDVAPPTSHYDDPLERAEYGVLSSWVWGHYITAISRKPAVASPLGQSDVNLAGVRNSARFLLATSDREGAEIAESLAVRFVLLTPLYHGLESMVLQLGHDLDDYATTHASGRREIGAAYHDALHSQLHLSGPELPRSERFRLVYEGHATHEFLGRETAYARIFELVRGATLTGICTEPVVELVLELRSDAGSELVYRRRFAPESDGRFAVTVPYASEAIPAGVSATGPVRVSCGAALAEVAIPHAAVAGGADIDVRFEPGAGPH